MVLPIELISIDQFQGPFEHVPVGAVNKRMGRGSINVACIEDLNPVQPESTIEIKVVETLKQVMHAYFNVGVIKPGTYTSTLLSGTPKPRGVRLKTPGCVSLCSTGAHPRKHRGPPIDGPSKALEEDNYKEDGEATVKRCCPY